MTYRLLGVVLAIGVASASARAQTQATFVLSNGQRHSGAMIYPRSNNNIVDSRFHLLESGDDRTFGLDDVVVIDFAGGTPSNGERDAVPNDNGGLMVMRNGSVQRGRLFNIVGGGPGGELVQWLNEAGQRNNYPLGDVSRLYLNGSAARSAFLGGSRGERAAAPAAPSAPGGAIRVDAKAGWVDTGLTVRRGDQLRFNASGTITVSQGQVAGVDGNRRFGVTRGPVPTAGLGALVGNVNGTPFLIGSNRNPIAMPADGRLMLGVNDNALQDNGGAFTVTIGR